MNLFFRISTMRCLPKSESMESASHRTLLTFVTYTVSYAIGSSFCTIAPTLVSMELLLDVTTKDMALSFVVFNIGCTVGSYLTGVTYGRVNTELSLAVASLLMSFGTICAPFTGSLYGYIACYFFVGMGAMFADAVCLVRIQSLWAGHRFLSPIVQGFRSIYSVALAIGPLIIKPYLVDLSFLEEFVNGTNVTIVAANGNNTNNTSVLDTNSTTLINRDEIKDKLTSVKYAYVTIGSIIFVPCIVSFTVYCLFGSTCEQKPSNPIEHTKPTDFTESKTFRASFLFLASLTIFFYFWVEFGIDDYLSAVMVKGLRYPNSYGAFIASTFRGGFLFGRVIIIPISVAVKVQTILSIDTSLILFGTIMMIFIQYHSSIIWIAAVITGLGTSSYLSCVTLWVSQHMHFDGKSASVFYITLSIGCMSMGYLGGCMYTTFGYMSVVYLWLSTGIALSATYVCARLFAYCYEKAGNTTLYVVTTIAAESEITGEEITHM